MEGPRWKSTALLQTFSWIKVGAALRRMERTKERKGKAGKKDGTNGRKERR